MSHSELDIMEPSSSRLLAARAVDLLDEVAAPVVEEEEVPKDPRELTGAWTVKATMFPSEMLPAGSTDFYTGQLAESDEHTVSGTTDFVNPLGTDHHGTLQGQRHEDSISFSVIWDDQALSTCQLDFHADEASQRGSAFFSGLFMTIWVDGTESHGLMELYPKE
jgi:hypothetical protein